jgi:hypothetical protein
MLEKAIVVAGVAQLVLALASLAIPRALRLREELARLSPLPRSVCWLWAVYVWGAHVAFAAVSITHARALAGPSPLAAPVAGFIAAWWSARLAAQFVWVDRRSAPEGAFYRAAEVALVALFASLALVYGLALRAALGGAAP